LRLIFSFKKLLLSVIILIIFSCNKENKLDDNSCDIFYLGADLSYVNEMEDCGAIYKNSENVETDVFEIFENAGANLIRVRLWHNPTWTNYSNLSDVKKLFRGLRIII